MKSILYKMNCPINNKEGQEKREREWVLTGFPELSRGCIDEEQGKEKEYSRGIRHGGSGKSLSQVCSSQNPNSSHVTLNNLLNLSMIQFPLW